jgi:hypothetical protein
MGTHEQGARPALDLGEHVHFGWGKRSRSTARTREEGGWCDVAVMTIFQFRVWVVEEKGRGGRLNIEGGWGAVEADSERLPGCHQSSKWGREERQRRDRKA